jgi:hypothetical protein
VCEEGTIEQNQAAIVRERGEACGGFLRRRLGRSGYVQFVASNNGIELIIGTGYAYQRSYLDKKYKNTTTTGHQLWSRQELQSSTYDVGTEITDHFQVVSKTPEAIVVRCGDSPLKTGVRDSDGLFEMGVSVNKDEGVAEFRLKSVFFKGQGTTTAGPMPAHVEFAHRLYTKLWMETAVQNVVL